MKHRNLLLLIVSVVCLVVAFLLATSTIKDGNFDAWVVAGLIAFVAAHLPEGP